VNIIPVIGKADCCTKQEILRFKKKVTASHSAVHVFLVQRVQTVGRVLPIFPVHVHVLRSCPCPSLTHIVFFVRDLFVPSEFSGRASVFSVWYVNIHPSYLCSVHVSLLHACPRALRPCPYSLGMYTVTRVGRFPRYTS
jgi:hypothetical protein